MFELGIIFVSGLLGSSHCIGMCGPFAISIGTSSKSMGSNLRRQLVYSVGRVFTYAFAGAVAGFCGMQLGEQFPRIPAIPAALAMLAGAILIYQGLLSAGITVFPWQAKSAHGTLPCLGGSILKTFLTGQSLRDVFLAGVFTGFLPCGLVYAFLALATSSADLFWGGATMIAFGLGTIPIMVVTGCFASVLNVDRRQRLQVLAAWCVVLAGVISVARGIAYLDVDVASAVEACPLCD